MSFGEDFVERVKDVLPVNRIIPFERVMIETNVFDDTTLDDVAIGITPDPQTKIGIIIPAEDWNECATWHLVGQGP
jgi:hypothetical protein